MRLEPCRAAEEDEEDFQSELELHCSGGHTNLEGGCEATTSSVFGWKLSPFGLVFG